MTDPVLLAVSRAIAETAWTNVPMADWAARADVPLADLQARFPTKLAILLAWNKAADTLMLTDLSADEQEGPIRDRLFALLMRRIDALQPGREALALLPDPRRGAPHLLVAVTPHLLPSMVWTLEAAGLATGGMLDLLRAKALGIAYGLTLRAFVADPSPDLSDTMKALDQALKRLQGWPFALPREASPAAPEAAATPSTGP